MIDLDRIRALFAATVDTAPGWTSERRDARDRATSAVVAEVPALLAEVERLTRERDDALATARQRWALRREVETLLGVPDGPAGDEQMARGVAALREVIAERDRCLVALEEVREAAERVRSMTEAYCAGTVDGENVNAAEDRLLDAALTLPAEVCRVVRERGER